MTVKPSNIRRYPRAQDIKRVVLAARESGLAVRTIEVNGEGLVRVSEADGCDSPNSPFEKWNALGLL